MSAAYARWFVAPASVIPKLLLVGKRSDGFDFVVGVCVACRGGSHVRFGVGGKLCQAFCRSGGVRRERGSNSGIRIFDRFLSKEQCLTAALAATRSQGALAAADSQSPLNKKLRPMER